MIIQCCGWFAFAVDCSYTIVALFVFPGCTQDVIILHGRAHFFCTMEIATSYSSTRREQARIDSTAFFQNLVAVLSVFERCTGHGH